MAHESIHFVTGRLAYPALAELLPVVAQSAGFEFTLQTLPISVAALMTPQWIAPRLSIPPQTTQLCLPGYVRPEDLEPIRQVTDVDILIGPKDLRQLPSFFGQPLRRAGWGRWNIEILAEINHAPRLSLEAISLQAAALKRDGADLIDVGCDPGKTWPGVGEAVARLVAEGHRVSIDSLNPAEIGPAVAAGAELVLSVNSSNRQQAPDWGCPVIAIPDDPARPESLEETMNFLDQRGVRYRIDPILEPIGFGFAASLQRYWEARRRWPEIPMMMGIGNLTELSDVDSAGINFLLLAICQELQITQVLTTQVIPWARTSVRECAVARQLVHYAIAEGVPPKHLSQELLLLRDAEVWSFSDEQIAAMAQQIRDANYRILAQPEGLHLFGAGRHVQGEDPFDLFDALVDSGAPGLDPSHAFYLGYELAKAMTARQLGKQYQQDQALDWGFLTVDEVDRHRLKKRKSDSARRSSGDTPS